MQHTDASDAPASLPESAMASPQIHLQHLMLWMLRTGIYLATTQWITAAEHSQWELNVTRSFAVWLNIFSIVAATINGFVMTAMIELVAQRSRGTKPLLRAPGHWLVQIMSVTAIYDAIVRVGLLCIAAFNGTPLSMELSNLIIGLQSLLSFALFAIATMKVTAIVWRVFLGCIAIMQLVDLTFLVNANCLELPFAFSGVPIPAIGATLIFILAIVVLYELVARRPNDWLHYAGTIGYIVLHGLTVLSPVVFNAIAMRQHGNTRCLHRPYIRLLNFDRDRPNDRFCLQNALGRSCSFAAHDTFS